jgi:iron complex outermembrane receptor protein
MTFKMKSMPQAILHVIASGALSAIVVYPALAQDVIDDTPTQRVVVTGSNISRADKETPSPVQSITADDLKKSGYTNVSDVLAHITANGQGALSQSFNQAFAAGASGIALRGLTTGATLVLIDGHRMAPYPLADDGQREFVDVSNIPFDAVERIDIVKDGASAVYGSQAIAGVVNVILKKSYVGTNLTAEGGDSQKGGGATTHITAIHGWGDLDTDGYNAYISTEFRHADAIRLDQRSGELWDNGDWTSRGGINTNPGVPNLNNGLLSRTGAAYLFNPNGAGGTSNAANFAFAPGCNYTSYMASGCAYKDNSTDIQPQTENINVLASFTKKLEGDWLLKLKASLFDSKVAVSGGRPASFPTTSYDGNTTLGPGIIPTQVGAISNYVVPASSPGNTTGGDASLYGIIPGMGAPIDYVDSKSYRLVAEVSGTLGGWDVDGSLGFTRVVTDQANTNILDTTALYGIVSSTTNPYNITTGLTPAQIAQISRTVNSQATDNLIFADARASHDVVDLPGGTMAFSAGVSAVYNKVNAPDAGLFADGTLFGNTAYALGSQTDDAAYLELYAPVLKSLEFDGAIREDHYNTYGNSTTPKIGFKFSPIKQVAFRGTLSKGFRAPGPAEAGNAGSVFYYNTVNDPILCKDGNTATAGNYVNQCNIQPNYVQRTSPDLKPEKSTSATFGLILEPIPGWSTTVDYYNINIKDQIISSSSLPGYVPVYVRAAVPTPQLVSTGGTGTTTSTPPVGDILYATADYVNANSTRTSGIDIDSTYKFKLGEYGTLKTDFSFTHIIGYELKANGETYELAGTHGPSIIGGNTATPKNKAQAVFDYEVGKYDLTTTVNWTDGYANTDPSLGENSCTDGINSSYSRFTNTDTPPQQYCKTSSFLTTDMTLTYHMDKHWTFHATILNLFDRQPPIDVATYGAAGGGIAAYNPTIAQAGAVGRYFNLGAAYRF